MSFNSGSTPFATQFGLKAAIPLDCRYVITNVTELIQLIEVGLYPGLHFTLTVDCTITDDAIKAALGALYGSTQTTVAAKWSKYKKTYIVAPYKVLTDAETLAIDNPVYDPTTDCYKFLFI